MKCSLLLILLLILNMEEVLAQNSIHRIQFQTADTNPEQSDFLRPGSFINGNEFALKSSNGDSSWTSLSSGTTSILESVYFLDALNGYAVGEGVILKTENGGLSWTKLNINFDATSVCFTDKNTGFAVGSNNNIAKTTDGGVTWNISTLGFLVDNVLNSVFFPKKNFGYAVGASGQMMKTVDGGTTWTPGYNIAGTTSVFYSTWFVDSITGYAVGWPHNEDPSIIIKTRNGGSTWEIIKDSIPFGLRSVFFTSIDTGYAVGFSNILKTVDGGISWIDLSTPLVNWTRAGCSVKKDLIYIVGHTGAIFSSHDGGLSWMKEVSGTTTTLTSVCFRDQNTGYAVGYNGVILKSPNKTQSTEEKGSPMHLFSIYPNPASNRITVVNNSNFHERIQIRILNVFGQEGMKSSLQIQKSNIYDISFLTPGLYFLESETPMRSELLKLIVY